MKIKEFENFNPEAELHVRVNEHIMEINDISWFDSYDRERSLESIKRSKAETTDVYLDSCTKMLSSNGFNELPVLDSDKIVLSAKFRVNKIKKPNCNLVKELKIKAIEFECSVADILNDLIEEYLKKEKAIIQGSVLNENE